MRLPSSSTAPALDIAWGETFGWLARADLRSSAQTCSQLGRLAVIDALERAYLHGVRTASQAEEFCQKKHEAAEEAKQAWCFSLAGQDDTRPSVKRPGVSIAHVRLKTPAYMEESSEEVLNLTKEAHRRLENAVSGHCRLPGCLRHLEPRRSAVEIVCTVTPLQVAPPETPRAPRHWQPPEHRSTERHGGAGQHIEQHAGPVLPAAAFVHTTPPKGSVGEALVRLDEAVADLQRQVRRERYALQWAVYMETVNRNGLHAQHGRLCT